jgi:hypothetical protein
MKKRCLEKKADNDLSKSSNKELICRRYLKSVVHAAELEV